MFVRRYAALPAVASLLAMVASCDRPTPTSVDGPPGARRALIPPPNDGGCANCVLGPYTLVLDASGRAEARLTFAAIGGHVHRLHVEAEGSPLPAAHVRVDGVLLVGPDDLRDATETRDFTPLVLSGRNDIDVQVAGRAGGLVRVSITYSPVLVP